MTNGGKLRITPDELHWLNKDSPRSDLCAHGKVRVTLNSESLVENENIGSLSVSTGALHLLRTLESNHTAESPIAKDLIPHCGHFMYLNENGKLENIGCSLGLNWWVSHQAVTVVLDFPNGTKLSVSSAEWWRTVTSFADAILAFFDSSEPKQPDKGDEEWSSAFWREWKRLRSCPQPTADQGAGEDH